MNILVCYHFFPHYRAGVIKSLNVKTGATFLGSCHSLEGINSYPFHSENYIPSRCYYFGPLMFQPKAVAYALSPKYDCFVFLANPNHISTWIAALICRIRRKRVIFWGHGFFSEAKTPKNRLRKLFFNLAHAFYTYGQRAKTIALQHGFRESEIYVGYNSLDYEAQVHHRVLEASSSSNGVLKIACVSRLTAACDYGLLLEACALARDRFHVSTSLTFVGTGPERDALEELARTLKLDAQFLGAIYDEHMLSGVFSAADVTVMPGKIGLTAIHSMMYGTPVISHDDFERQMPEVESIVPGLTGELFRYGSLDSLAECLGTFSQRFPSKEKTRQRCFKIVDEIYNPDHQSDIMLHAVHNHKISKEVTPTSIYEESSQ